MAGNEEHGDAHHHGHEHHQGHDHHRGHHEHVNWFNENAETYEKEGMYEQRSDSFIEFLRTSPWFHDGIRVLDYGCGTGRNVLALADSVSEALGMDVAPKMLELFQKRIDERALQSKYRTLMIHATDGSEVEAASRDFVMCAFALHHIDKLDDVFKHLAGALVSGGYFLIGEMADVKMSKHEQHEKGVHRWLTEGEIDQMASANALEKVSSKKGALACGGGDMTTMFLAYRKV